MQRNKHYRLPSEARKDIKWWYDYLPRYNGTLVLWYLKIQGQEKILQTDACFQGCGGTSGNEYFRVRFPRSLQANAKNNIALLELHAIIIGLKLWSSKFQGLKFTVECDNIACVLLINSGKAKNMDMQNGLREIAWIMARNSCWIRATHLPGKNNEICDWLSRWSLSSQYKRKFRNYNRNAKMGRKWVKVQMFENEHTW